MQQISRIWLPVLCTAACFAQANQEIVTDRPDITEASTVIPVGSVQFENGVTWTNDRGVRMWDLPETLVRVGVASCTELRLSPPGYFDQGRGERMLAGFSDASVGVKEQLGPLPGRFDLAVILALSVPTGAPALTSHGLDPFLKLPWSRDLKGGWSIGGMQSLFYDTDQQRRRLTWETTFYLEREVTRHADVFLEYGDDYSPPGASRQVIHSGAAYRFGPRHQIDVHFGFGLSHTAPQQFFAAGYSFRLDHLFGK